jgi:sterile alpha motif and leucine zipper-containing kinase AZK
MLEMAAGSAAAQVNSTAPEVLRGEKFDGTKADAYSLGIMMWEVATRSVPWKDWTSLRVYAAMTTHGCIAVKRELKFPEDCGAPEGWEQLAHRCWSDNPAQRPSMNEIVGILQEMIVENKDLASRRSRAQDTASLASEGSSREASQTSLIGD